MEWKDHLNKTEAARIARLERIISDAKREYQRIWERARKRMQRERENGRENDL